MQVWDHEGSEDFMAVWQWFYAPTNCGVQKGDLFLKQTLSSLSWPLLFTGCFFFFLSFFVSCSRRVYFILLLPESVMFLFPIHVKYKVTNTFNHWLSLWDKMTNYSFQSLLSSLKACLCVRFPARSFLKHCIPSSALNNSEFKWMDLSTIDSSACATKCVKSLIQILLQD